MLTWDHGTFILSIRYTACSMRLQTAMQAGIPHRVERGSSSFLHRFSENFLEVYVCVNSVLVLSFYPQILYCILFCFIQLCYSLCVRLCACIRVSACVCVHAILQGGRIGPGLRHHVMLRAALMTRYKCNGGGVSRLRRMQLLALWARKPGRWSVLLRNASLVGTSLLFLIFVTDTC